MPYFLLIKDYKHNTETDLNEIKNEVKTKLTDDEVDFFLMLQDTAKQEIEQNIKQYLEQNLIKKIDESKPRGIELLGRDGLLNYSYPGRAKQLLIALAYNSNEIIGYCFSYLKLSRELCVYISVLFVKDTFRGKNVGDALIRNIIQKNIKHTPNIEFFEAITLPNNFRAIKLLEKLGFNYRNPQ